jgi:sugar lactone lactonase YvrE
VEATLTRGQKRKIALLVILLLLLALLGGYYAYYRATHRLAFNIAPVSSDVLEPPQFLYSFAGDSLKLQRPIGVMIDNKTVYVVDSVVHRVFLFEENGKYKGSFGESDTVVPLNIAKNPIDKNLYVTDRRQHAVLVFSPAGKFLRVFDPKLPANQLPKFATGGVQWDPVTLTFGPDGTMYVAEILNGHRLLIFSPNGTFKRSVGDAGMVADPKADPKLFQFPNGIIYHKGSIYIADSNNQRVQVFDKDGNFKRIIVTAGLPRGIAFLNRFPQDKPNSPDRFVTVDTLAHDGTIWTDAGSKLLTFGSEGLLDAQFEYPNGVAIGSRNRIFVTDTSNGRVQVWGWPNQVSPVPAQLPRRWWLCLAPLLLLPLLLLFRKRRFFATDDFLDVMIWADDVDLMPSRRRRWLLTEEDYERYRDIIHDDVDLGKLFEDTKYSESDVRSLMDRLEIDEKTAIVLSIAQRAHVFCTENDEYRRLAKVLEIDVVNRVEFIRRFESKRAGDGQTPPAEQ